MSTPARSNDPTNSSSALTAYPATLTPTDHVGNTLQSSSGTIITHVTAPTMKVRPRRFDLLPEELGDKIFHYYLQSDRPDDMAELARKLRHYACFSKAHREEVAMMLSTNKALALFATCRAIPSFIGKQHETLIPKAVRPAMRMEALVRDHPVLYADFRFGIQMGWGFTKIRHNRRPKQVMKMLMNQSGLKTLRLDISGPRKNTLIEEFNDRRMDDAEKRFAWVGKHERFVMSVAKKIREFTIPESSMTPIELVYRNWPNSELVARMLETIAEEPGKLRSLDLSHGFEYEESLVSIFQQKQVDLAANFIGPICKLLTSNTSLKRLKLANARMGVTSFIPLASVLPDNTVLEYLDLSYNIIRRASLNLLLTSLEKNNSLREINLSGTDLTDEDADRLQSLLEKNQTLQLLDLSENDDISLTHSIWDDPRVIGFDFESFDKQ